MSLRATVAALLLLTASAVIAADPGGPWHAVAKAPRVALPDVSIDLGYPGPYLPTWNSPIALRTVAAQRFDGYIGFHFAVGANRTGDTPVVARAAIQPGQAWSFTTWAGMKEGPSPLYEDSITQLDREIVIEWRNHSMEIVAKRSVGVPPWSVARPLQVGEIGVTAPIRRAGTEVVVFPAHALSEQAQWYSGFSAVIVPVALWLDLPPRIREAIFGSGRTVVFFGFPRDGQALSRLDHAMLPVEFEPRPAAFVPPWPWRGAGGRPVMLPMSWKARAGSAAVGKPDLPVLVSNRVAVWAPGDDLLEESFPVAAAAPFSRGWKDSSYGAGPTLRERIDLFRPLIAGWLVLLLSMGAWMANRRLPRLAVVTVLVVCSAALLGSREWIRTLRFVATREKFSDLGNGVVHHRLSELEYGPTPIAERVVAPELARTALFGETISREEAETRSASTPRGFGSMVRSGAGWDAVERYWSRREFGEPPGVRIVARGPGRLVIDYDSPIPVQYAQASWVANGKRWYGEARLPEPMKGRVTIGTEALGASFFDIGVFRDGYAGRADAFVYLIQKTDRTSTVLRWTEPFRQDPRRFRPYEMAARMLASRDANLACSFAIPVGGIPARGVATLFVASQDDVHVRRMTVTTAGGTFEARNELPDRGFGISRFTIPGEALASLRSGGVLLLTGEPSRPLKPGAGTRVELSIQEKSHD